MSRSRLAWHVLSLALAGLLLAGCASIGPAPAQPPAPTDVKVAMGFIPNVQFAPWYVALERGYFEDEGLNITLDYGFEADLIKLLAVDELQFVVGSGEQIVLARSQGLPVVYVMQWYRQFPVSIVALAESGINEPADLIGKTVGTPVMHGASYIGWKAVVEGAGLPEEQINLQAIGYTQVASLLEGRIDAAVCYTANEPVQLRTAGHEVTEIMASDYVDVVPNGLLTNEKSVSERGDTVERIVRALVRGIEDAVADPAAAFEIALEYVPEAGGDNRAVQQAVLERSVEIWRSEQVGLTDREDWAATQDFMLRAGLISEATDVDQMFTNQFVPDGE